MRRDPLSGVFDGVLERLTVDATEHFKIGPVTLVPVASQDRLYSYLLRLAVREAQSQRTLSHLFVKIYKRKEIPGGPNALCERVAADFESTRRAHTRMKGYSDVGIVPPVACYPDLLAIVTEQVEGITLLEHLQQHACWFPRAATMRQLCDTMRQIGRWIGVYQTTSLSSRCVAVDELRTYVDRRLRTLRRLNGIADDERAALLRAIDVLGSDVSSAALAEVAIHADLALGNVLISRSRVVVLDFAMAKFGTRLHDLTRLFVQLDLLTMKPQFRRDVIIRLQKAMLEGFDPSLHSGDPLFRILCLLHRVNNLTTLVANRGGAAEAVYNGLIRRRHRRSIAREIAATHRSLEPA